MKKKIIIGVSALLVVITSIVIYILVILSPYRNIDNLIEYIAKEDAKYEATIEYSTSFDSEYIYLSQYNHYSYPKTYTTLYNRVSNYKFSEDTVVAYHYADFETTDGEYVTNELYATCFFEQTETEAVMYSCILTGEEQYSSNALWSKGVVCDGDISTRILSSAPSMYRFVDQNYSYILSRINLNYKEVDGIYYQALNGVKIVDYPTTVELKTNKAIITINNETATPTVITLSKLKTTKVKSPLPDATNDGFIFDYNEDSNSYNLIDYTGSSKNVEIPETYNDGINGEKVVDTIGQDSFYNSTKMESITISSNITKIDSRVFYGCSSLESITIPVSVTSIGSYAFYGCSNLESIAIPSSVTIILADAFKNCDNLEKVYYDGSIEDWCNITFAYHESNPMYYAKNFYMKNSETNEYEEVTSIEIPDSVTSINWSTFYGFTNLESIIIPDSVTSIENYAFYGCSSLESIIIPDGVTSIEYYVFYGCSSLESITIPSSVTSIEDYAFYGCSSLESIEIPENVTSIGKYAFCGCSSLESITIPKDVEIIRTGILDECDSLETIYVSRTIYSNETYMERFPDGVTIVYYY